MSYLPYIENDMEEVYDGMDWWPDSQYNTALNPTFATLNCCTTSNLCEQIGIDQEPKIGRDGFQVWLDVANFKAEEISVDTENNVIVIHAKQEEQGNALGYTSREFVRRYELPDGFKPEDVVASLSCDGILMIRAPNIKYRSITIQKTGPARMCLIENIKGCEDDNKIGGAGDKNGKAKEGEKNAKNNEDGKKS